MRILATLLFPALALAVVGYTMVLPAVEVIGKLTATIAGVR